MPVSVPPAPSRPGEAQTSGCATVATVALLLLATGSAVVELTVAVFVRVPALVGVLTEMTTVIDAPLVIAPNVHVTVAVPEHDP